MARAEDPPVAFDEVGQGGVVEDGGGGVSNVEEELEEAGVAGLGPHQAGELCGIAERGERPVEESHDVSDDNLGGRAAKLVAPLPASPALHDPGVLEGQENRLEELLGNPLALGDLVGRDGPSAPPFREVDERLEGVEAALGDLQMYPYGDGRIFGREPKVKSERLRPGAKGPGAAGTTREPESSAVGFGAEAVEAAGPLASREPVVFGGEDSEPH